MNTKKTNLKLILELLNMTSKDLAAMLTAERDNGGKTSEATVSRWVTGKNVTPAGVKLYLKARLFNLLKDTGHPIDSIDSEIKRIEGCIVQAKVELAKHEAALTEANKVKTILELDLWEEVGEQLPGKIKRPYKL